VSLKREEAVHKMEVRFDLLSSYFAEGSEIEQVDRIYEWSFDSGVDW
jgi:hypothetical protein